MRLRFSDVKSMVAKALHMCSDGSDDARLLDYVNRATERLLYDGKWVGTYGRYRVCVNDSCLTWPRELETIEAVAVCDTPGTVRGEWFEFLESGPGLLNSWCGDGLTLVDRGQAVAFDDVKGTGKKLAVYCDGQEEAGASVILRFYDENGKKVRTLDGSAVIEGEKVIRPDAGDYVYTTNYCMPGGLYEVIKPVTKYMVRLYEWEPVGNTFRPLAYYEPDETLPTYRRSVIPGLGDSCCGTVGTSCSDFSSVTVAGKLRFIPATGDNSILMISHKEAIRLAVQAVKKEEDNMHAEAFDYWHGGVDPVTRTRKGGAIGLLQMQLDHYKGAGQVQPIRMVGRNIYGGGITNLQ